MDGKPSTLRVCFSSFVQILQVLTVVQQERREPGPNSCSPTMTNTHNLLPSIIETENQIPTGVQTQTLIPMLPPWWGCCITITAAEARRGLATSVHVCVRVSVFVYVCVCVCGLTGAHILPEHQHGHLGDAHPFLNYLPAFLRAYLPSLILHSHQRRLCWKLWRPLCVTQGHHSLFFLHFPLLVTFLCANSLLHVWEMIWGEQTGDGI